MYPVERSDGLRARLALPSEFVCVDAVLGMYDWTRWDAAALLLLDDEGGLAGAARLEAVQNGAAASTLLVPSRVLRPEHLVSGTAVLLEAALTAARASGVASLVLQGVSDDAALATALGGLGGTLRATSVLYRGNIARALTEASRAASRAAPGAELVALAACVPSEVLAFAARHIGVLGEGVRRLHADDRDGLDVFAASFALVRNGRLRGCIVANHGEDPAFIEMLAADPGADMLGGTAQLIWACADALSTRAVQEFVFATAETNRPMGRLARRLGCVPMQRSMTWEWEVAASDRVGARG